MRDCNRGPKRYRSGTEAAPRIAMEAERSRKSNRGGTAHCNRGPSGPRIAMKGPSRAEVVPRRPRAVIQEGRTVRWRKGQRQPNKQKTTANHSLQAESPLKQVKRKLQLQTINGPQFSKEEHGSAARVCAPAKSPKSLQMDFTSW